MRANFVLAGVAAGIRRNAAMTIALVLNTAIALAFVGGAILANTEISKFKQTYEDKLNVSVYLCTDLSYNRQVEMDGLAKAQATCADGKKTSPDETAQIQQKLTAFAGVKSVSYISEQQAFNRAKQLQAQDNTKFLKVGDLPASFTVKLNDIREDFPGFSKAFSGVAGVDSVTNSIDVFARVLSIVDSGRWASIVAAIIILIASILLIANTIQTAAAQRKNETSIMRLVGASRWMTELPFILEAIIAAAIGGLISFGLLWTFKHFLLDGVFKVPIANGTIPNLDINDVLVAGGTGLIFGIVLSAITAFVTLRWIVRL